MLLSDWAQVGRADNRWFYHTWRRCWDFITFKWAYMASLGCNHRPNVYSHFSSTINSRRCWCLLFHKVVLEWSKWSEFRKTTKCMFAFHSITIRRFHLAISFILCNRNDLRRMGSIRVHTIYFLVDCIVSLFVLFRCNQKIYLSELKK